MTTIAQPALTFDRWLQTKPSERKLGLFSCACARHPSIWALLTDSRSRQAVEVAERFADGLATSEELQVSWHKAPTESSDWRAVGFDIAWVCAGDFSTGELQHWLRNTPICPADAILMCLAGPCVQMCQRCCGSGSYMVGGRQRCPDCDGGLVERALPTLCGDPKHHRHESADACGTTRIGDCEHCQAILRWHNATIPAMAQALYDGRCWEDMPILGDALEDAGVTNQEILAHCRATDTACADCKGKGHIIENVHIPNKPWEASMLPHYEKKRKSCKSCQGTGRLPAVHAKGCWCLDLILGKG